MGKVYYWHCDIHGLGLYHSFASIPFKLAEVNTETVNRDRFRKLRSWYDERGLDPYDSRISVRFKLAEIPPANT